jgi:hypothetical protein
LRGCCDCGGFGAIERLNAAARELQDDELGRRERIVGRGVVEINGAGNDGAAAFQFVGMVEDGGF